VNDHDVRLRLAVGGGDRFLRVDVPARGNKPLERLPDPAGCGFFGIFETSQPPRSRAGIARYWIVNLPESRVEVYAEPLGSVELPDYRRRKDYGLSETIPVLVGGAEIGRVAVVDLLP